MRDYSHGSYVDVILRSSDLNCRRKVRMRVDLNDSYTRFPAELLEEMGWSIRGWISMGHEQPDTLPNGSPAGMALGAVTIEINDMMMRVLAVFEDDDCQPALGAHLLHCLGVKVAPEHRTMFADEILYPRPRKVFINDPR
jgi:hypothetical protein